MADNERIKTKAIFSAIWKFMERIIAQSVSLVVSIILARLLEPSDYSAVSLVTIFFTFGNILISGGLNAALIQKKDADEEDYSSMLFFCSGVSLVVYFTLFFAAPIIAQSYKLEILVPIIRIMGLTLPINAVKSIACAYISAHLQFRKFFFATIGGTIFSAVVGIYMAYNGFGAWALVAQQMTNAFIDTVILYITTKIPLVPKINFHKLKGLLGYSWKILVSNLLGVVYTEINPLFIGLRFSTEQLAFYSKGKNFPNLIASTTNNTLSAVLFPVMAKFQDDKEKLLNSTRLFIRTTSYLLFPLMVGLFAIADTFVAVVLTEKWMEAVPFIRIFCVAYMFEMIHTGNCETIKAMGRSDIYLVMEIIKKVSYFITIGIFMFFSNSPTMLAFSSIICTFIAIVVNSIPNIKILGYKVRFQVMDMLPNFLISLAMGVVVYFIGKLNFPDLSLMIIQVISGGVVYILLSIATRNRSFKYLLETIKSYIKR